MDRTRFHVKCPNKYWRKKQPTPAKAQESATDMRMRPIYPNLHNSLGPGPPGTIYQDIYFYGPWATRNTVYIHIIKCPKDDISTYLYGSIYSSIYWWDFESMSSAAFLCSNLCQINGKRDIFMGHGSPGILQGSVGHGVRWEYYYLSQLTWHLSNLLRKHMFQYLDIYLKKNCIQMLFYFVLAGSINTLLLVHTTEYYQQQKVIHTRAIPKGHSQSEISPEWW